MKVKVNDIVVPKTTVARVVDITKDKIVLERHNYFGETVTFEWTADHAKQRDMTLEELINDQLYIIEDPAKQ